MIRALTLSLALVSVATAQEGPLSKAGRALDQTGKNIRSTVETGVARGQIAAQERDIINRVGKRIDWDKEMAGSTLKLEAQPGGVVILQGSVLSESAKMRAVDLAQSTTGVTSVVDQIAVAKETRVIGARPDTGVIRVSPEVQPAPTQSKVIVKP